MQKYCKLCRQSFLPRHLNNKYCGGPDLIGSCSWKVKKIRNKFSGMKERVTNPSHKNYQAYKNLKIDPNWLKTPFSFVLWASNNGWKESLTIDRIDNNIGYFPTNCRFVTHSDNIRNKKSSATDWKLSQRRCRICKIVKGFNEMRVSRKEVGGIAYECKLCGKQMDKKRWAKYYSK